MAVEIKVKASSAAALGAGLIDFVLGQYVFKGHHVDAAVTAEIYAAVPAVLASVAGYFAPHTPRPAATPAAPPSNVVLQPGGQKVVTDALPPSVPRLGAPPVAPGVGEPVTAQPPRPQGGI